MPLFLKCYCCGHKWFILGTLLVNEYDEELTVVGTYDDICPRCLAQGEIFWLAVLEDADDDTILETDYNPQPVVEADPAAYDHILFG